MKKEKISTQQEKIGTYMIVGGLCLVFGWALVLAATNWLMYFPCTLSPQDCGDGRLLAKIILYTPAILGTILLPIGTTYNSKMTWVAKLGITVLIAPILLFLAFWLMVLAGIGIHGLGG